MVAEPTPTGRGISSSLEPAKNAVKLVPQPLPLEEVEMDSENQDLLDLCRLNQMEENIQDSVATDRDETLKAIDYKKRQLINRLIANRPKVADKVMEKHIEQNTLNGIYPWTDGEEEVFPE